MRSARPRLNARVPLVANAPMSFTDAPVSVAQDIDGDTRVGSGTPDIGLDQR